jgi:hypothetical protein
LGKAMVTKINNTADNKGNKKALQRTAGLERTK